MPSEYESMIAAQAMAAGIGGDGSRHYTNRDLAEEFASRNSRFNYMMPTHEPYQGRADPVDMVRKQVDRKPAMELYQNPIKGLTGEKSIYASLLNYEFMN